MRRQSGLRSLTSPIILVSSGLVALAFGTALYLSSGAGETYLRSVTPAWIGLSFDLAGLLGPLRGPLPAFIHPFAFSLIGMGLFARTRRSRIAICAAFAIMNLCFELGQGYAEIACRMIPDWFQSVFILENAKPFFIQGRFSFSDLAAVTIGSAAALMFAEKIKQERGYDNECPPQMG
ncbi:MAG: hypothetical protein KKB20_12420 [Proteobacteria bacterium]|nr:hypothetical protein [Pseudomonadota bacterium]